MAVKTDAMPGTRARVTIRDVAQDLGLALSTVSNALAGKAYVREDTRKMVLEAARRLGYRASAVAQAMRTRRTNTIGVLMADVANPSSPDFLRGIEDVAVREKFALFLCNTDESKTRQLMLMRSLLDRQVDGLVLISQYCGDAEVRELLSQGPPFILMQRRSRKFADNFVGADNRVCIAEAVRYLSGLGHRRIGYVIGPAYSSAVAERLASFRRTVAELKLDADPELIVNADYGTEAGHRAAKQLLDLKRRPTAVMASNDMNALGVLDVASERGIAVPDQLSVVGLDDIALASLARINLTTIALPKREMGAAAATLLIERINSTAPESARQTVMFPAQLVIRGSTGPAPRQRRA